jgi:CheY-like chemotaxis protein
VAFNQVDNSKTRQFGGTGMGLALCSKLCALMNGRIWVESTLGVGSHFHLIFEALAVEQKPVAAAEMTIADITAQMANARVLLVEDNLVNQLLAVKFLQKLGVVPDKAMDGLQALVLLEKNVYDLVLMDMQMPNMDGLEATRQLRSHPDWHQPIVIAVTANAFPEDRQACLDAGMDDFFAKPININELSSMLIRYYPRP